MKPSTAKSILKSLQSGRLESFLAMVDQRQNGKKLRDICLFIHASSDSTETEVMRKFKLSRGQYFHWMDTIAEALSEFITRDGKIAYLGQCYEFVRSLIAANDVEAATELLQSAKQEAVAIEEFGFVVRFCQLACTIDPELDLGGMSEERADLLKENLDGYERLMRIYQTAKRIPHVVEKRKVMKDLVKHPLLSKPSAALSNRATYYYLKLRSLILGHLMQNATALELQSALVTHLESYPWISEIEGLALVQELDRYAKFHYLTGNLEQYHIVAQRIHALSFCNPKVDIQRIRFLYPVRIGIGMEHGNHAAVIASINGFLEVLEASAPLLDKQFITRNLYTCYYGAIAAGDKDLRRTLNRLLFKYRKADFQPQYYTMYRLLEVIHAMEKRDWDDARRLISNRTKRAEEEVIPKAAEALRFLSYLITLMEPLTEKQQLVLPAELRQLLKSLVDGSIFSEYFDLEVWVESKERGCPMLDIFGQRASSRPGKP